MGWIVEKAEMCHNHFEKLEVSGYATRDTARHFDEVWKEVNSNKGYEILKSDLIWSEMNPTLCCCVLSIIDGNYWATLPFRLKH